MRLYAGHSAKLYRQIAGDLFVVVWSVVWFIIGRVVDGAIRVLADPARQVAQHGTSMGESLGRAADEVGRVPVIGADLRIPFAEAAASVGQMVAAANDQVTTIESVATLMGVITFAVPFLLVLLFWLPGRIRFVRTAGAVRRLLDAGAGADLFALRALATEPIRSLAQISDDPVADWRAGNRTVIKQLAATELGRYGLTVDEEDLGTTDPSVR